MSWDRNPEPDIDEYEIYYGKKSGTYEQSVSVSNDPSGDARLTHPVPNLCYDTRYYFALKAVDKSGKKSGYSSEKSFKTPPPALEAVSGTDETEVKINFEPAGVETPEGYFADTGQNFGPAVPYGWIGSGALIPIDHNSPASPDQAYDTVIYAAYSRKWEMAVPAGTYEVTVCIGSPSFNLTGQTVRIEGVPVINAQNLNRTWLKEAATVGVTDGRLTISFEGTPGCVGIDYVIVRPADGRRSRVVDDRPPVPEFDADTLKGLVPLVVAFDASASSDPDGNIVVYHWDFGDGEEAIGVVADHTYNRPGIFIVTLTVIDDSGAQMSKSQYVEVREP